MKKIVLIIILSLSILPIFSQDSKKEQLDTYSLEGLSFVMPPESSASIMSSNSRYNCEMYIFFVTKEEGYICRLVGGNWVRDKFTYSVDKREIVFTRDRDKKSFKGEWLTQDAIYVESEGWQRGLWIKLI